MSAFPFRFRIEKFIDQRRANGWQFGLDALAAMFTATMPACHQNAATCNEVAQIIATLVPTSINRIGKRVAHGVSARIKHK